jgi:hypothetical protein
MYASWADPASVVEVFVYLASDESQGVTGKRFQAQEDWVQSLKVESHE